MGVIYSNEEGCHRFEASDESLAMVTPIPTSRASFSDAKKDFIRDLEFNCNHIKRLIELAHTIKEAKNENNL